ncbi:MAG: OsmC family protein [Georgenia sp.]
MTTTSTVIADPTPRIADFTVAGTWRDRFSTDVTARDFAFTVAEPDSIGGTDEAPNPIEYLLGSLNGCISVVVESVAEELGITVEALSTHATGSLDLRGFRGTADVSPHFQQLTITLTLTSGAPVDALAELRTLVLRRCPVFNLIKDAGVDLREEWTFLPAG